MKLLISFLVLVSASCMAADTANFTEFYCNSSTGSNTNAGSSTGSATYSSVNGNWDGTSVFIPTDGSNPVSGGVTTNTFASVYNDGASVAVYIARITAVTNEVNGGIVLDTTAKSGTAPTSSATGRSITVGGVWKGPNGTSGFPFTLAGSTLTNASGYIPCINFANGSIYSITAAITASSNGPIRWEGYASSVHDGGRAMISFGSNNIAGLTLSGNANQFLNFEMCSNRYASGASALLSTSGAGAIIHRVIAHDSCGSGISISGSGAVVSECSAYSCNGGNTATVSGFDIGLAAVINCISYSNTTANANGFRSSGNNLAVFVNCIAYKNGADGFVLGQGTSRPAIMIGCDSYSNGGDGVDVTATTDAALFIKNSNLLKNTGYGINSSGTGTRHGIVLKYGLGAGTEANGTDVLATLQGVNLIDPVTYASGSTPWNSPSSGDFKIILSTAKATGRGLYLQVPAFTGTTAYPDIGAAQASDASTGSSGGSYIFAQ